MFKLNIYHILFICFVYITNRIRTPIKNIDHKDFFRDTLVKYFDDYVPTKFMFYTLTLIPICFFIDKPNVVEHVCALYVYHLVIRSLQNVINPQNHKIDYTTSFFVISLLVSLQSNYIGRGYINYVYLTIFLHSLLNIVIEKHSSTSSISNDVILAHLIFFTFRTY